MPRREDVEAEVAGVVVFTRLDLNSGFHQIPLDEETSRIFIFSAPFGGYRFLRLPSGISSSPDIFQKTLEEIFEAVLGANVYVDDLLILGTSRTERDERLRLALQAGERVGVTFNRAKCTMGVEQIEFLGDVIDAKGIRLSPSLRKGMTETPPSADKLTVKRMLAVVNYCSNFAIGHSKQNAAEKLDHERRGF